MAQPGYWDAKNYYETTISTVEFHSCDNAKTAPGYSAPTPMPPHGDVFANRGAKPYAPGVSALPRYQDSKRALHLLRRCWACAKAHGGNYTDCEHSGAQVALLARAVAEQDMHAHLTVTAGHGVNYGHALSWACGANMESGDVCTFDLTTGYQVEFWSLWYDVMSSQPGVVSQANLTRVADGLL